MSTSSSQRTRTATPHRRLAEGVWGTATPLVLAGMLAAVLALGGCAGGSTPAVSSSVALRPAPGAGAPGSPAAAQRAGAAAGGSHAPFVASPAGGLGAGALEPGVAVSGTGDPAVAPGQVLHGPRGRRWIALTFDADMTHAMQGALRAGRVPGGWYDRALFDELRATQTPATIFLTGLWTAQYPDVVRRLSADPRFELDNHSVDHSAFATPCFGLPTVGSTAAKRQEIASARAAIRRASGHTPRYFRFPGGCATGADVRLVRSYGELPVLWDVVSGDAFQRDPDVIVRSVLDSVRPGSIIVAHCIGAPNTPATAAALHVLIPRLRGEGYRFVTLSRLLSR